jgi:hypothetical protein
MDRDDSEPSSEYTYFYGKRNVNYELDIGQNIESVSVEMAYIILRDRWCDSTVLNNHAPTEDKIDDVKDSSY